MSTTMAPLYLAKLLESSREKNRQMRKRAADFSPIIAPSRAAEPRNI